jgi:hypothetical protein
MTPAETQAQLLAEGPTSALLLLIPSTRPVVRKIVAARCVLEDGHHVYSWGKLAAWLGCDRRVVVRWYREGLQMIASAVEHSPSCATALHSGVDIGAGLS